MNDYTLANMMWKTIKVIFSFLWIFHRNTIKKIRDQIARSPHFIFFGLFYHYFILIEAFLSLVMINLVREGTLL